MDNRNRRTLVFIDKDGTRISYLIVTSTYESDPRKQKVSVTGLTEDCVPDHTFLFEGDSEGALDQATAELKNKQPGWYCLNYDDR